MLNPANHADIVGTVKSNRSRGRFCLNHCSRKGEIWFATPPAQRASFLIRAAELMEQQMGPLGNTRAKKVKLTVMRLLKSAKPLIFSTIMRLQVAQDFDNNTSTFRACSLYQPLNFPLAIFSGQIAAALAAGNTVLVKPAEQTPSIASKAVALFHQAGVPSFLH